MYQNRLFISSASEGTRKTVGAIKVGKRYFFPLQMTHNLTHGRIKHLLSNWTNYMSGSGHRGAASGSEHSWTVNARSQERGAKCLLIWPSFGCLVFLKGSQSQSLKTHMEMALAIAVTCSALSPKVRLLMKPDPHTARRVHRAVLLQEIFLKGVMQRAGHASSFSDCYLSSNAAGLGCRLGTAWREEQHVVSQVTTGCHCCSTQLRPKHFIWPWKCAL